MEITSYYDTKNGVVYTTPVGEVRIDNVKATAKKALELAIKHRCKLLLFDIRNCPVKQTLLEGFQSMQNVKETLGFDNTYWIAIVYNPDIYPEDRAQFIETVVANRANPKYRMFKEADDAYSWLREYKTK